MSESASSPNTPAIPLTQTSGDVCSSNSERSPRSQPTSRSTVSVHSPTSQTYSALDRDSRQHEPETQLVHFGSDILSKNYRPSLYNGVPVCVGFRWWSNLSRETLTHFSSQRGIPRLLVEPVFYDWDEQYGAPLWRTGPRAPPTGLDHIMSTITKEKSRHELKLVDPASLAEAPRFTYKTGLHSYPSVVQALGELEVQTAEAIRWKRNEVRQAIHAASRQLAPSRADLVGLVPDHDHPITFYDSVYKYQEWMAPQARHAAQVAEQVLLKASFCKHLPPAQKDLVTALHRMAETDIKKGNAYNGVYDKRFTAVMGGARSTQDDLVQAANTSTALDGALATSRLRAAIDESGGLSDDERSSPWPDLLARYLDCYHPEPSISDLGERTSPRCQSMPASQSPVAHRRAGSEERLTYGIVRETLLELKRDICPTGYDLFSNMSNDVYMPTVRARATEIGDAVGLVKRMLHRVRKAATQSAEDAVIAEARLTDMRALFTEAVTQLVSAAQSELRESLLCLRNEVDRRAGMDLEGDLTDVEERELVAMQKPWVKAGIEQKHALVAPRRYMAGTAWDEAFRAARANAEHELEDKGADVTDYNGPTTFEAWIDLCSRRRREGPTSSDDSQLEVVASAPESATPSNKEKGKSKICRPFASPDLADPTPTEDDLLGKEQVREDDHEALLRLGKRSLGTERRKSPGGSRPSVQSSFSSRDELLAYSAQPASESTGSSPKSTRVGRRYASIKPAFPHAKHGPYLNAGTSSTVRLSENDSALTQDPRLHADTKNKPGRLGVRDTRQKTASPASSVWDEAEASTVLEDPAEFWKRFAAATLRGEQAAPTKTRREMSLISGSGLDG